MRTIYDTITINNPSGGVITTAKGKQVSFNTAAASQLTKASVEIGSTQNLNGFKYPWGGGMGVNLLPYPYTTSTTTISGVTFTMSASGVRMTGTATADVDVVLSQGIPLTHNSDYSFVGGTKTYETDGVGLYLTVDNDTLYDTGAGIDFRYVSTKTYTYGIKIRSGTRLYTTNFAPMVTLRENKRSAYTPYINECTITGNTSAALYRRKTKEPTGSGSNSYTRQYGQTVYSGSYDFISGTLNVEYDITALSSSQQTWYAFSNATYGRGFYAQISGMKSQAFELYDKTKCLCTRARWADEPTVTPFGGFFYVNGYVYFTDSVTSQRRFNNVNDFKSWLDTQNISITYPLATPTQTTLTAQSITTNNVKTFFDTGATAAARRNMEISVTQTAFRLPRPNGFNPQREDIYAGTYTTCNGATRADCIGWKYSDMTLSWDALSQNDVMLLCSLKGAATLTFDDPLGDTIQEPIIRSSIVSMRNRNKFMGDYWWTGVSCSIKFTDSHTD